MSQETDTGTEPDDANQDAGPEMYDLIVIGAGSGLDVASAAVRKGLNVALVEDGPMGGTCLNRGCIPSKMLIHRADLVQEIKDADKFGIDAAVNDIDFQQMMEEVNNEVESDAESIEESIRNTENLTLYKAEGRFVDKKILDVRGERITGEKIVVAAGTRPFIPPVEGLETAEYITSKEALQLEEQPEHLVILGGGYIAAELAHFYGSMGTEITIIEMEETLLPREDGDISERFTKEFSEEYNVYTDHRATQVTKEDGMIKVIAKGNNGGTSAIKGDELLIAAGRIPNTDRLNVEAAGIETDDQGFVETNKYLETTADDTWALGDIAGNWMFKHSANLEAEYVYTNALTEHRHEVDYTAMPHAIFSHPRIASVGYTEQELEKEGIEYVSEVYGYERTGMGSAMKAEGAFVKILVAPQDGEILGVHILGPHASMLIHEVLVAMKAGSGTILDLINTVHIHPALNEVVQRAFSSL